MYVCMADRFYGDAPPLRRINDCRVECEGGLCEPKVGYVKLSSRLLYALLLVMYVTLRLYMG